MKTWKEVADILAQAIRDHDCESWDENMRTAFSAFLHKRSNELSRCAKCHRLSHKTKECPHAD